MSKIVAVQSAFPSNYYSQAELTSGLLAYWGEGDFNPKVLERFHRSVKVAGRYLALSKEEYLNCRQFEQRNSAWLKVGLELGKQAIAGVLARMDLCASEVDQLIFTTVTGLAVPSLDARLMNRIEFRKCIGTLKALFRFSESTAARKGLCFSLISVPFCSKAAQKNGLTEGPCFRGCLS